MSASRNEKIFKLETELQNLKEELGLVKTPKEPRLFFRVLDGALKYWTLVAILGLVAVQTFYGVPYFESIQNSSTRNKSSESFRLLGDNMMEHAEFIAAREAYANALLINANNIEATHGLMKAEVLKPVGDGERYSAVVVESKLRFLKNVFENDYILPYWEGIKLRDENDQMGAKDCFAESIKRNPRFIGGYLELGYTNLIAGDPIEVAIRNFSEALKIDPNYALANNSLGYCYLFKANMNPTDSNNVAPSVALAVDYLKKSDRMASGRPDTKLNLGDAYRYKGPNSYGAALASHLNALELVESIDQARTGKAPNDMYSGVQLIFPYLIEIEGKPERTYVQVTNREQMKIFVLYALSFDYALMGKTAKATESFNRGYTSDNRREYGEYFANRIRILVAVLKPETKISDWFDARVKELLSEEMDSENSKPKEKSK